MPNNVGSSSNQAPPGSTLHLSNRWLTCEIQRRQLSSHIPRQILHIHTSWSAAFRWGSHRPECVPQRESIDALMQQGHLVCERDCRQSLPRWRALLLDPRPCLTSASWVRGPAGSSRGSPCSARTFLHGTQTGMGTALLSEWAAAEDHRISNDPGPRRPSWMHIPSRAAQRVWLPA
jgi:hypothetical protein